jgi:predicted Ser/Thr protein kinase
MPRADDDLTVLPTTPARAADTRRFATGSIIAGRYRLVALLGKGGMGEVYRAEDLTLDQPVALKFLPEGAARDAASLARFHHELRVARQVSHKNVCRLYDLGEAEGRRFLTMEYVDGEDLASLVRRIGRIQQDKAIDIARQICAGLAAAHERGVLHRDLKPANVMLDGEGNIRITDFGLAVAAGDTDAVHAGTPQYMAPEQLAASTGHGAATATTKTDIYALGLVLFEIFTGRRAYEAKTIQELRQLHETGATPSSLVRDLDPAIERIILRCLERDPERRPASALAVAAALPGGNPLAEALAAGETPSPDLLVAAAETEAIPVATGLALLAALLVSMFIYAILSPRATMADLAALEKAPAVLADRANQIIVDFGYTETPADTDQNFRIPPDYPRWLAETDQTTGRWKRERVAAGPALLFWYRTSPRDLEPDSPSATVSPTDPAMTVTGQTIVVVDTHGRLVEFRRVPPQRDTITYPVDAPKWDSIFRAAGLDASSFKPVTPEWIPKDFADVRAAWESASPTDAGITLRVEAAAYRGRIVSAYVLGPWARPRAQQPLGEPPIIRSLRLFAVALWVTVLGGAIFLARRNLKSGRADQRSAARLAVACLAVLVAAWAIGGHHLPSAPTEVNSFFRVVGNLLLDVAILWVLYLALEPYGRRFWPDGLLGWTRLLSGRVRDPRIGREILIGSALAGVVILADLLEALAPYLIGRPPGVLRLGDAVSALNGPGALMLTWASHFYDSVQSALIIAMLFVALRLLVRRTWIAAVLGTVLLATAFANSLQPGDVFWLFALCRLMIAAIITFAIFRFGLLVTTVMIVMDNIPTPVPIVLNGPAWASWPANLSIALVAAIACFGFYAARAGQPLFGTIDGQA